MCKYFYFIRLVLILRYCTSYATGSLHLQQYNEEQSVTNCIITILRLSNKQYTTIIDEDGILDLAAIHEQGNAFISQTFTWSDSSYTKIYVIATKTYEQLAHGLNLLRYHFYWNPEAYFVMYIDHLGNSLHNLSRILMEYNILNITVVTRNEQDSDIYSHTPKFNACNKSETLVLVSQCSNINRKNMFPFMENIATTLRGCQFKIMAQKKWPPGNYQKTKMLESLTIKLFEEFSGVKFHIIMYDAKTKSAFPVIPEGIWNNSADMVMGGHILTLKYASLYSYGYPLSPDSILVVIRHEEFLSSWQATFGLNLLQIFMMLLTLIMYCMIMIRWSMFPRRQKDAVRDVFIIIAYFLNKISIKNIRSGTAHKLVFTTMLFFVFIIPYMIQGYLYSLITQPRRGFEERDSRVVYETFTSILPAAWTDYNQTGRTCTKLLYCLLEIRNNRYENLYTLITSEQLAAYRIHVTDDQCDLSLYTLKDPYLSLLHTFYFRRGSILTRPFNKFLLQLNTAGLMKKTFLDLKYREQFLCKPKHKPRQVPQSLRDVKEAIVILLMGYVLSIITFIFECIWKKRRT